MDINSPAYIEKYVVHVETDKRVQMKMEDILLEHGFQADGIDLITITPNTTDEPNYVCGTVTSSLFSNMAQNERQDMLHQMFRTGLSEEEYASVGFILAFTPQEQQPDE